jgi:hypothetical protein
MTSTAALRWTRAGAALAIAVGALLALAGVAAAGAVPAAASSTGVHTDNVPFSFD